MKNILLTTLFLFLFSLSAKSQIIINEVQAVTQGNASNKEFVELKGPAGTSLGGYLLVLFDENSQSYGCYDLDTKTISGTLGSGDGYFLIGNLNMAGVYEPAGIDDKNWLRDGLNGIALYQLDDCPLFNPTATCGLASFPGASLISSFKYYSSLTLNILACPAGPQYLESANSNQSLRLIDGSWEIGDQSPGEVNNPGALPVELTSFESKVLDNNSVILFWQTASEENNSHFIIEHSRDGQRFNEVGKEMGMGSTTNAHTYNMRHERLSKGYHYYRLKQVDFDGKYEYSNIITAQLKLTLADVTITPNPAMEKVMIFIDTPISIAASYQLVNMQKEVMLERTIDKGNSSFEIDMTNLPAGVYFMRFYVDQQVIAKKIVKLY